jgi:hypothetical protein
MSLIVSGVPAHADIIRIRVSKTGMLCNLMNEMDSSNYTVL